MYSSEAEIMNDRNYNRNYFLSRMIVHLENSEDKDELRDQYQKSMIDKFGSDWRVYLVKHDKSLEKMNDFIFDGRSFTKEELSNLRNWLAGEKE
jgi:hypothetical protein